MSLVSIKPIRYGNSFTPPGAVLSEGGSYYLVSEDEIGIFSIGASSSVYPIYNYIASGNLSTTKCGKGYTFVPIPDCIYRLNPGDTAWLGYKAEQGIFEGFGPCIPMYIDTWNAIYSEWDLLTFDEATDAVNAYLAAIQQAEAMAKCLK